MSHYFSEMFESPGGNVKVELELSNYGTKVDLTGATSIDKPTLKSKVDLASLKTNVHNLSICKLMTVPAGLGKLSPKIMCMIKHYWICHNNTL